jgi:hypothetical protein
MKIISTRFCIPLLITGALTLLAPFLKAQDTIAMKVGGKIPARVISATGDTLSYKEYQGLDTARVSKVSRLEVAYVRYSNGFIQTFGDTQKKSSLGQLWIRGGFGVCSESGLQQFSQTMSGFNLSASYVRKFASRKRFAWEAGIGYTQKGGVIQMNDVPLYQVGNSQTVGNSYGNYGIRLGYLSGEVFGRAYLSKSVYMKIGIQMGYLIRYKGVDTDGLASYFGPMEDPYKISDFKHFSAGGVAGGGLCRSWKRASIFSEILFNYDFTPLGLIAPPDGNGNQGSAYHSRSFILNLGVYFNL